MVERAYTVNRLAEILDMSPHTVRNYVKAGRFPGAFKMSSRTSPWLIPESAVDAYRASQGPVVVRDPNRVAPRSHRSHKRRRKIG